MERREFIMSLSAALRGELEHLLTSR